MCLILLMPCLCVFRLLVEFCGSVAVTDFQASPACRGSMKKGGPSDTASDRKPRRRCSSVKKGSPAVQGQRRCPSSRWSSGGGAFDLTLCLKGLLSSCFPYMLELLSTVNVGRLIRCRSPRLGSSPAHCSSYAERRYSSASCAEADARGCDHEIHGERDPRCGMRGSVDREMRDFVAMYKAEDECAEDDRDHHDQRQSQRVRVCFFLRGARLAGRCRQAEAEIDWGRDAIESVT